MRSSIIKRGFAPIADFGIKDSFKAFRINEPKAHSAFFGSSNHISSHDSKFKRAR